MAIADFLPPNRRGTALPAEHARIAHFHCPDTICSSVACIADINLEAKLVKLVCGCMHAHWLPWRELARVDPYWPTKP